MTLRAESGAAGALSVISLGAIASEAISVGAGPWLPALSGLLPGQPGSSRRAATARPLISLFLVIEASFRETLERPSWLDERRCSDASLPSTAPGKRPRGLPVRAKEAMSQDSIEGARVDIYGLFFG
ncbi:hypothetical protein D3C86_1643960 [compost metagenome]